jgi:hypothetical protein
LGDSHSAHRYYLGAECGVWRALIIYILNIIYKFLDFIFFLYLF